MAMEKEIKLSKDRAEQVLEWYGKLKVLTDYYREENKDIEYIYNQLCFKFNCYDFDGELFDIEYVDVVFTYLDKFGIEDYVLVYNNEYEDWEQFSIKEIINAYMGERQNEFTYILGVERLNEKGKPIEHIEYEELNDYDMAVTLYNSWAITDGESAKYMYQIRPDGEKVLVGSKGYNEDNKKQRRIEK